MRKSRAVASLEILALNRERPRLHHAINGGGDLRSPFRSPALLGLSRDAPAQWQQTKAHPRPPGAHISSPHPRSQSHPSPLLSSSPWSHPHILFPTLNLHPDPIPTSVPSSSGTSGHPGSIPTWNPTFSETQPTRVSSPCRDPSVPRYQCTGLRTPRATILCHAEPWRGPWRSELAHSSCRVSAPSAPLELSQTPGAVWAAWVPGRPEAAGSYGC